MRLALDANLTLLLVIGLVSKQLVGRHKRLAFTESDFDLLQNIVARSKCVRSTPNALTEVSNIAEFGLKGTIRRQVADGLRKYINATSEHYVPSTVAAAAGEFSWLGLSDCAWLCAMDQETHLLTVDHSLYQAALKRGLPATNFNHLREASGTLR